ncbi:PadR family transcriptional regulator [Paenibacillus ginsengihumi]|uniref:PadR family transcriptional regulator n=1 Tax=Paenibacillus ginsengihumi TaxID=431596 RepID=UPI00037B5F4E|nr:PadR family transcriptional regulator [Paenibacillus ginsengihumi]
MYELFVLAELMTGEKHGYVLQDILKNSVGLGRKISSGTLYPLLLRMMETGWIRLRMEEETKGGRTKKIYAITDAGREQFQQLMKEPLDPNMDALAETETIVRYKMVYFQYVDKEVRISCLKQYLQLLEKSQRHVLDSESYLLTHKPEPEKQRVQLLRVFDLHKRTGEVKLRWVREELARIEAEED